MILFSSSRGSWNKKDVHWSNHTIGLHIAWWSWCSIWSSKTSSMMQRSTGASDYADWNLDVHFSARLLPLFDENKMTSWFIPDKIDVMTEDLSVGWGNRDCASVYLTRRKDKRPRLLSCARIHRICVWSNAFDWNEWPSHTRMKCATDYICYLIQSDNSLLLFYFDVRFFFSSPSSSSCSSPDRLFTSTSCSFISFLRGSLWVKRNQLAHSQATTTRIRQRWETTDRIISRLGSIVFIVT